MAQEPSELRDDIEETRAQMSQTVDAIQERLSPSYLKDEIKDAVRESTIDARDRVEEAIMQTSQQAREGFMSMIRDNPLPAAAAGASLAWLFMSARRSSSGRLGANGAGASSRYDGSRAESWRTSSHDGEGATDPGGVTDRVQQVGADVTERAQQMGAGVQQQASEVREMASDQMHRVTNRLEQMLEENPMAVGAAALAAGAVIGMVIPGTRRENELLGEAREALGETVQERVHEVAQQAGQVMDRMQDESGQPSQSATSQAGMGSQRAGTGAGGQLGMAGGTAGAADAGTSDLSRASGSTSGDTPMGSQAGDLSQTARSPQGSQPRRPA